MHLDLSAIVAFVIASTFSPGPNNVMSGTLGVMYGYRRTLPFMLGIFIGFAAVMIACAAMSTVLLGALPPLQSWLLWVGAAYVLWLAWATYRDRDKLGADSPDAKPRGFVQGVMFQFANPKVAVYGLVLFGTLLAPIAENPAALLPVSAILAATSFTSTSLWALGGTAIRGVLREQRQRNVIAGILALTLVYTALEMVDLPQLLVRATRLF